MGLMQKLLGGGNQSATQSGGGLVHDGSHTIDKSKVLAATDSSVKYMDRNIYTDIILQGSQEENFRFYFV